MGIRNPQAAVGVLRASNHVGVAPSGMSHMSDKIIFDLQHTEKDR